jgi:hypothetical protein
VYDAAYPKIHTATALEYTCAGLPCEPIAWGNGIGSRPLNPTDFRISVYPSPSHGSFTVSWTNESGLDKLHYEVELYNALGQVVAHIQAGNRQQVDIPLNRKGIFLGRVKAQGQVIGSFKHIGE